METVIDFVSIADIKVLEQPRKDFSLVDELAESIKRVGLLQPLAVRRSGVNGHILLVDGEQRLRALKQLGKSEAPVFYVEASDEQAHKEAQMIANLFRSDLSWIERARGFSRLLENTPAKYNEKVIANRFGIKEKEVQKMVAVARKIDSAMDAQLSSGQFNAEDFEELSKLPSQFQKIVLEIAVRRREDIRRAIHDSAQELCFDSVFTKEQARSAGKIHYVASWGGCYTFDKEFAAQNKKDYEARTKKKHDEELKKEKATAAKQKELTAEQKQKVREKKKADATAAIKAVKENINAFIKRSASKVDILEIVKREVARFSTNELRIILRAFDYKGSVAEMNSDQLKRYAVKEIFGPAVKTPDQLANLIELVHLSRPYQCDTAEFAKSLAKGLK